MSYQINKLTGTEPRGARSIVYDELDNIPKNRPMTPPTLNLKESVIYSDIKAPTDPNKV